MSWCGSDAVPAHHVSDGGEVRRAAGRSVEHRGDLSEVVSAEDPGRDDRECSCVDLAPVVEAMDCAAGDAERLAGGELRRRALDCPGEDSLELVDRLLVFVVTVCGRDLRPGRDVELEDCDCSGGLIALDEVADGHVADPDVRTCARCHCLPPHYRPEW